MVGFHQVALPRGATFIRFLFFLPSGRRPLCHLHQSTPGALLGGPGAICLHGLHVCSMRRFLLTLSVPSCPWLRSLCLCYAKKHLEVTRRATATCIACHSYLPWFLHGPNSAITPTVLLYLVCSTCTRDLLVLRCSASHRVCPPPLSCSDNHSLRMRRAACSIQAQPVFSRS